jgi:uncharacterized membrane protein YiaA
MTAASCTASDVHDVMLEDDWTICKKEAEDVSFSLYMVGYILFVVGLGMAAHFLNVPPRWIAVGIICLAGLGILTGVTSTRHRDPPT